MAYIFWHSDILFWHSIRHLFWHSDILTALPDLDLAVFRQPAVPTEIWSSRKGGRKEVTLIKSRDPHLVWGKTMENPKTIKKNTSANDSGPLYPPFDVLGLAEAAAPTVTWWMLNCRWPAIGDLHRWCTVPVFHRAWQIACGSGENPWWIPSMFPACSR